MTNWNITAPIRMSNSYSIPLIKSLELDRGIAVIGTSWTELEIKEYFQDRKNHLYCWTDNLAESDHADGKSKWCDYRVIVGLRYGIQTTEDGSVIYRTKTIDHMVVDHSLGVARAYEYCNSTINDLAARWTREDATGKIVCHVDDRDSRWVAMFQSAGFITQAVVNSDTATYLRMELGAYDD